MKQSLKELRKEAAAAEKRLHAEVERRCPVGSTVHVGGGEHWTPRVVKRWLHLGRQSMVVWDCPDGRRTWEALDTMVRELRE